MKEYDKLMSLLEDDKVGLASSFKELINKELCLGQTRYLCRNGTLSDGHEKITDSQRYYQAIKEMYYLGSNIRSQKALAMMAQADVLDAQDDLQAASKKSEKLRAEGKLMQAHERLIGCLVTVEDQMRMLDEYNKIRQELGPQVKAQYPEGIEQAELDNWTAVAEYRAMKRSVGFAEPMTNLPLPKEEKVRIGIALNQPDMLAWDEASKSKRLKLSYTTKELK